MTSLKGDLRSIMGTPFGGVGHAVLIFSRVTRAAFNSDSVVLQLHDRIEIPEDANGKFPVDGLDPGPIRVELEGGTVHNHGWNIDLPDEGTWSLADLVDAQVDWSPAVIGRAEAAAREARDHADRAEAGADRVGTAEQVGVWASEASSSASAAASARSAAQTARNASQSARDAAEGHADRAATSESNAKTSETNAKQSETNAGDYAAVATTAATEAVDAMDSVSDIIGANYATHEYVDASAWARGVVGTSVTSIDELDFGSWGIASTTVANNLNLPFTQGTLQISRISRGKTVVGVANVAGVQQLGMWMTSISGGVVAPWKRIDIDADGDGAPGLKTVGVALTAGSALDGTPGRCRVLAQVKAPVTRWRVHIESLRQVSTSTANFTLGAVSVGKHSGNGNITSTTSLKSGNTSISGSSEWVSRWVTNDLSEETLIDFTVSGTGLYSYQAAAYRLNGSTWEPAKNVPVSVWIEVETYAETPVVAMIGDSTGAGQGADRPVHESALHVAGRKHGFIPMNMSYPGSTMQSMTNPEHHIYKRWGHLAKPDSVIVQAGSNDIHGGTSTAELQTRFNNLAELALTISPVVFGATVKARYPNSGDFAPALTAHNAYVKTQPAGTRDYLDFYQVVSPSGTVAAADAADAAHLSTLGHAKLSGAFDSVRVSRPPAVSAADVAVKADKSYVDQRVPIDSFTGTGSPEGKVAASVGSIYTDTAATNGAIRWVKTSGTGNTGWVVEYGDTGWRLLANWKESQSGEIYIRRVTNTCFIRVSKYTDPGNYAAHMATIPAGFRPVSEFYGLIANSSATSTNSVIGSYTLNTLSWTRDINGGYGRPETPQSGEIIYSTTNSWPTSLPGTPA